MLDVKALATRRLERHSPSPTPSECWRYLSRERNLKHMLPDHLPLRGGEQRLVRLGTKNGFNHVEVVLGCTHGNLLLSEPSFPEKYSNHPGFFSSNIYNIN